MFDDLVSTTSSQRSAALKETFIFLGQNLGTKKELKIDM